jgi:small subunit ribosomal protein S13
LARIAGIDLPKDKRVEIGLTAIYGIGRSTSNSILRRANINLNTRVQDLTDEDIAVLRNIIEKEFRVEGDLHKERTTSIKRLMDIGSYRGLRHRRGLPARGQRTSTNARTRKGPKKAPVRSGRKK